MNTTTITNEVPTGQILVGDAKTRLAELPDGSIDTIMTSPPYFRLRNYQTDGQIGLEDHIDQWVNELRDVFAQVRQVLAPHGSMWLNLGDSYSRSARHGAQAKSLLLGPERLLLGLEKDGWLVRNKVIWAKPNPMPSSVKDRLSCTWEPLYLLTRSPDYYFDLDAIRTPPRSKLNRPTRTGRRTKYSVDGVTRPDWSGPAAGTNTGLTAMKAAGRTSHPLGKNPGDVWTIPTAAYRGAHFATFPSALVERPLKATCPQRVCTSCGQPWRRATVQQLGALATAGKLRKSCACADRSHQPGVVLDPFFGAGTVGVSAVQHGRRWIGIELSETFARQAERRIAASQSPPSTPVTKDRRAA